MGVIKGGSGDNSMAVQVVATTSLQRRVVQHGNAANHGR